MLITSDQRLRRTQTLMSQSHSVFPCSYDFISGLCEKKSKKIEPICKMYFVKCPFADPVPEIYKLARNCVELLAEIFCRWPLQVTGAIWLGRPISPSSAGQPASCAVARRQLYMLWVKSYFHQRMVSCPCCYRLWVLKSAKCRERMLQ